MEYLPKRLTEWLYSVLMPVGKGNFNLLSGHSFKFPQTHHCFRCITMVSMI